MFLHQFESNIDLSVFDEQLFHKLYAACQPESFDILLFQLSHLKEKKPSKEKQLSILTQPNWDNPIKYISIIKPAKEAHTNSKRFTT